MSNKSHNLTLALLQEITIKNLKNCTQDEIGNLWNKYKRTYYGKA